MIQTISSKPYKLTVHIDGEEETFSFSSLDARDAFVDHLQSEGYDTGPLIPDEDYQEYADKREKVLLMDGVFIDILPDGNAKFSFAQGAYEKIDNQARQQGLSIEDYLQRSLNEYAKKYL